MFLLNERDGQQCLKFLLQEQLKEELLQRLSESSAVPENLLLEVRSAKLLNFETNRCKLDVQTRTPDGISWNLEAGSVW